VIPNVDLAIGHIPNIYDPNDFFIVPLNPLPAITYTIDDFRAGRVYRIRAYIKNIGSTQVDNIKTFADIRSDDGRILVSQETQPFSLNVNQEALVTFYLPYKTPGNNKLNVHAEYLGNIGYTLSASLNCP